MMKAFFIERRSWIALFILLQALSIFIAYLDPVIPVRPVLYIVFLSSGLLILFLLYRYQQETRFYKSLRVWDSTLDRNSLAEAVSPFEKIIEESIIAQTEKLKQETSFSLKKVDEEKDELLSWIHEVKTPLTAMQLIIERLEDRNAKASLHYEWLRIHLLLDQQLHQKRLPFMENDLFIENTDLKAVLFSEMKTLQSWCMQKGIGFDVDLKVTTVLSDTKWLAFIIRQLLTNGVKYSNSTDIEIRSFERSGHAILEITDHGCGISARDLPRIFEKGFTSTMKHYDNKATGMGLYLAKKAAGPLNITIDARSMPGKGSTFSLVFPTRNDFTKLAGM
ncbi:sensor histidine kinase [Neobacillus notoginsengisoli]|uniref:histidine kinase n=1 Tax=Neobacillus notoginsengisoli TaxID=1578198 RepID=A0A417YTE3_9BACI|nr:sensor histidine kinase [Neobacillus notoginsengisoli]RHW40322.1 sensor histidine kinase [Neobacillus notoginsengisoli]